MDEPTTFSRAFKGIWIPKEIWLDKRLTYFERCLLAEIHSLDDPERGCYASNQYFCEFFNERERKIQEGLSKLKQCGYIIQEKFDGRIRTLRANLNNYGHPYNNNSQPFYGKTLFNTSDPSKNDDKTLFSTPGMSKTAPLPRGNPHPSLIGEFIEPDNKAYNKDKKEEHPPNPPEGGSVREACGAFVKLTKKEKEALEEVYGASRVEGIIEEINDYLASTGKKPYKDYAAAIRQWARRRGMVKVEVPKDQILEDFQVKRVDKRIHTKEELDEIWFNKLESAHNLTGSSRHQAFNIRSYLQSELRLHSDMTGINFTDLPEAKFFYGEDGFRAKVDSTLRKLDIIVVAS